MGKCLQKLVITSSGDVGHKPDQLRKWVEANGGRWVGKMQGDVTHMICSKDHWKKNAVAVVAAHKAGIHCVSFDWLEDSLQSKRKLAEKKYLWEILADQRHKQKQLKRLGKKVDTQKFEKGCQKACEELGSGTSKSTSVSRKPSRSKGGFFVSAVAELAKARAERETQATAVAAQEEQRTGEVANKDVAMSGVEIEGAENGENDGMESVESEVQGEKTPLLSPPAQASLPTPPPSQASMTPSPQKPSPASKPTCNPQPPALTVPGAPKAEKLTDNYHTYLAEGFEYNITLFRTNLFRNCAATYNIRIFESHTKPHVYCTFVRYTPPAKQIEDTTLTVTNKKGVPILLPVQDMEAARKEKMEGDSQETKDGKKKTTDPRLLAALAKVQPLDPKERKNDKPFRSLLTPMNADYATAFRAFECAFRDLTLLSWSERTLNMKALQKHRAQHHATEPFIYRAPNPGLSQGLLPAIHIASPDYTRGELNLPGMNAPLTEEGTFGRLIFREREEAARIKWETEKSEMEKSRGQKQSGYNNSKMRNGININGPSKAKQNYNAPLFNSLTGSGTVGNAGGYPRGGYGIPVSQVRKTSVSAVQQCRGRNGVSVPFEGLPNHEGMAIGMEVVRKPGERYNTLFDHDSR